MAVAWVLFPLVMLVVGLGCGLLVERLAGFRLSATLIVSLGLAVVIVVPNVTTESAAIAPYTTVIVVALALAGYAVSWRRLRALTVDPWAAAVAGAVFLVYAAPVLASGHPTFLGYSIDGDPAFHLGLASQLLARGHNLAPLARFPNSSEYGLMREYLTGAYPVGADLAVGTLRPLVGENLAWVYQPYMAVTLALGAAAVHQLLRDAVRPPALRALCAFIAAQAGLVYSFYLVASIKELVTTWIVTVSVLLAFDLLRRPMRVRAIAPLALMCVAGLDVLAVAIVPWLGIPVAVFIVLGVWRNRRRLTWRPRLPGVGAAAAGAIVVLGFAAPALSGATKFVSEAAGTLTNTAAPQQLGDLLSPLPKWEVLGIWPTGDFRLAVTTHYRIVYAMLGVAAVSAVLAVIWMVRRRAWAPLVLIASDAIAAAVLISRSSPYAASKVMMIASLAAALAAMLGGAALYDYGRRLEGVALSGLIAFGVLWTNALSFHHARPAPQPRFAQLASIDRRFAGTGPTFYNLWDFEFPTYFLRKVGISVDTIFDFVSPRPGTPPRQITQQAVPWDPNDINLAWLEYFRLLVTGRSPILSRPPANYRLAEQTAAYDVWRRTSSPRVLQHIAISGGLNPGGPLSCRQIRQVGRRAARAGARLAYVPRPALPTFDPASATHPKAWFANALDGSRPPDMLQLNQQPGTVTGTIDVPTAGRYHVWLEGTLTQRVTVLIDGRAAGSLAGQIGPAGLWADVGSVTVSAGEHSIAIRRAGASLGPTTDTLNADQLGPVKLVPGSEVPPVSQVAPSRAASLCGRPLEWLEIVR